MTIVPLEKVTLYGLAKQRDEVLRRLQELGCLHLIDLQMDSDHKTPEHPSRNSVREALTYLHACRVRNPNQHDHYTRDWDCLKVTARALEIKRLRKQLSDEWDELVQSIRVLEPWGDFHLAPPEQLGGLRLWFHVIRARQIGALEATGLAWQKVAEDLQFVYVVVVSAEEPAGVPGQRVNLGPRPLSQLKARLEQVDAELESLHWQRVALTGWNTLLARDLDEADDEVARMEAMRRLLEDKHLFVLQGWAPRSTLEAVRSFARRQNVALAVEPPSPDDSPPTLLENPRAVAGAENVVTFYITPAYRSWDPTWVIFFSFAFFFAMIMSDAAYSLILGGVVLLCWKKLGGSEPLRRFRNLLVAIVAISVIYGVAMGSYFGVTPFGLDRWQLKLDGRPLVENRDAMMIVSISIGVLHLTLANLITAWRYRGRSQALSSLGWVAALLGGLVFGLASADSSHAVAWVADRLNQPYEEAQRWLADTSFWSVIAGLVAILVFSSSRPLFTTRLSDCVWRLLDGLQALTNVTRAFGDTLSYLRLFALGLASAQLAITFNDVAKAALTVPGLGVLLAILILILGHGINILLGIMGGVVHGLRLNFIEFFGWSLTEEGHPFRAFCRKAGG